MPRVLMSVILSLLALNAFGQMAPDIAKGTLAEEVIRTHGWPKGKSVAGGRESWLYDRFQVLFQNGKVVSVSYIATVSPDPFALVAAPKAELADPGATTGASSKPPYRPLNSASKNPLPASHSNRSSVPADYLVTPSNKENSHEATSKGFTTLWVLTAVSAAGILMGFAVLAINRREATKRLSDDLLRQKQREPLQTRRTWEEEVAERIRQANEPNSSPPPTSVLNSGEPVTTSEKYAPSRPAIGARLTLDLLRSLEWKRFEQIVALYYSGTGVRAEFTCDGPDGGVDVKLHRSGEERPYCYIQCKAWNSEKVKLTTMREFLGVMAADKISEGVFITTSDYWAEARAFATANGIAALTANDFIALFGALPDATRSRIINEITSGDYTTPSCPSCGRKMVWKPSTSFWTCPKFPVCRSKPIYPRTA